MRDAFHISWRIEKTQSKRLSQLADNRLVVFSADHSLALVNTTEVAQIENFVYDKTYKLALTEIRNMFASFDLLFSIRRFPKPFLCLIL